MNSTITLQELRDHAAANPAHVYPVGSCTDCLAADLLKVKHEGEDGRPDVLHESAMWFPPTGKTVRYKLPEGFDTFIPELTTNDPRRREDRYNWTGAQLAEGLTRIINGESPRTVADQMKESVR